MNNPQPQTHTPTNPATIIPTKYLTHYYKLAPTAQAKLLNFYQHCLDRGRVNQAAKHITDQQRKDPETLCFTCKHACNHCCNNCTEDNNIRFKPTCSWADSFKPVKGWQAIPTHIKQRLSEDQNPILNESYLVIECPLYEPSRDTYSNEWGDSRENTDKFISVLVEEFKDCNFRISINKREVMREITVFKEAHYMLNGWKKQHPKYNAEQIHKAKRAFLWAADEYAKRDFGRD